MSAEEQTDFNGIYSWLTTQLLPEQLLRTRHFPRSDPKIAKKAVIYNLPHKYFQTVPAPNKRRCRFCFQIYVVNSSGEQMSNNFCCYHDGRRPRPYEKFSCCGKGLKSTGCKERNFHVTSDNDPKKLNNFIISKDCMNSEKAIYSIDCEFVHTNMGMELAAISVIDQDEKLIFSSFVLPDNPIVDYLTQFSNLTEENFSSTSDCLSMDEYRQKMRQILGPNVIVIGHAVSQDLLRMGVIQDKIVDTSVMFPHPDGNHLRIGLTTLKDKYMKNLNFPLIHTKAFIDCSMTMKLVRLVYEGKIIP